MPKSLPERIGRFKVLKELGKGSQGVVYLATDPNLDRQVAIKTIHLRPSGDGKQRQQTIIREAKTVSKLQHPNIIAVYEAGESEDGSYVVFEYVDGVSLRDLIRQNGGLGVDRAANLMKEILGGIDYAHQQGVIHRDISPSNILVSKNDVPRIMDFGVSVKTGAGGEQQKDISGTPCYMSPEHFSDKGVGPQADIFSLGLVFYEMLTGRPAIRAENEFAAMYKIAHEPVQPPSMSNPKVGSELDQIVLRATARDPSTRYAAAIEMKKDLEEYLNPETGMEPGAQDAHGTLEFLLRRMRHKSDFPTFSQYIVEINQKASAKERNYTSASQLANVIIKDYALTSKLLKLVNSAFYGSLAGEVTTVSRAVVILGFEQVKFAAASLMLFDHLQNKSQKDELQDAAASSFMSALIAKDLAERLRVRSTEEAFICAMLHRLGKHLVIFYFPEDHGQISRVMTQKGVDENSACRAVLGISYEEIGSGVAKTWKFPDKIIQSMTAPQGKVEKPGTEEDLLQVLSAFSNELCQIVSTKDGDEGQKAIDLLLKRYGESISIDREGVVGLLQSAKEKMESYSEILNFKAGKNRFFTQVERYSKAEKSKREGASEAKQDKTSELELYQTLLVSDPSAPSTDTEDPDSILINGIQEVTNTLLENYEINDALTMILETIYRGFRFHHVLLCLLDKRRANVAARFGFGENVDKILDDFQFPIDPKSSDIFNLALSQGKDLGIENSADPRIKKGLPEWYMKAILAPAFIVCPIVVNGQAVGLVYADRNSPGKVITLGNQIKYMKTLCNQAVLAMKQLRRKS